MALESSASAKAAASSSASQGRAGHATGLPSSAMTNESASDEAKLHREAEAGVRLKAQRLRRALDADRLDEAIKYAADVAAELRSQPATELSPKMYYDVYLAVASELRFLEMYVSELARRGEDVRVLYEKVQETPLVLPRLYLLVTVGSVYIKSFQAASKHVLKDLVVLCAGVQHPHRGLFLRAYLAQMMKDKLPDLGSPYASPVEDDDDAVHLSDPNNRWPSEKPEVVGVPDGGDVREAVDFVIRNFTEMNKLWVRMQHDCAPSDLPKREQERLELRLLVGTNIGTLSRLQGVDLEMYMQSVLPSITHQIITCQDSIAQEYLAECVGQVFPDDFQLATLDKFMIMCGQLVRGVNIKTILVSIIGRLVRYADNAEENAAEVRTASAFKVLLSYLPAVLDRQHETISMSDRIQIFLELMRLSLASEPTALNQVNDVLGFAVQAARDSIAASPSVGAIATSTHDDLDMNGVDAVHGGAGGYRRRGADIDSANFSDEEESLLVRLLMLPLEAHPSVSTALALTNFGTLQGMLRYRTRRRLAVSLLQAAHSFEPCISDTELLDKLFDYVSCLVEDEASGGVLGDLMDVGSGQSQSMFNAASLSAHHEFILSSVPGAASFLNPQESGLGAAGNQAAPSMPTARVRFAHGHDGIVGADDGDPATGPGVEAEDEEAAARALEQGQELVSRIIYFCDVSNPSTAFDLYSVARRRLLRGGETRIPITLPPLIMAALRLCTTTSAPDDGRMPSAQALDSAYRCLQFAVDTIDVLREISPEVTLRLSLQAAMTAAAVSERLASLADTTVAGEDVELEAETARKIERPHVYENISRAFEVFESGIVFSRAQFAALELIIGTLVRSRSALQPDVFEALASRTVMHAKRLLTRSDQCLALCLCADLYWSSPPVSGVHELGTVSGRGIARSWNPYAKKANDTPRGRDKNSGNNTDTATKHDGEAGADASRSNDVRDSDRVLETVNAALKAACGCVNDGERVFLLLDVAHRMVRLQELGCTAACEEERLDEVLGMAHEILDEKRAKSSIVGRAASTRLQRLCVYIKNHSNEFGSLGLKNVKNVLS